MKQLIIKLTLLLTIQFVAYTPCNAGRNNEAEPIKFIVTGGPSSGKTTTLLHLEAAYGEFFIPEAAADCQLIIKAEGNDQPWNDPTLNDKILKLQKKRLSRVRANEKGRILLDRSPIDILAYEPNPDENLLNQIKTISQDPSYSKIVFLIKHLGHVEKVAYRNENIAEAIRLEESQAENYQKYGFEIVEIPFDSVENRSKMIIAAMNAYMKNKVINNNAHQKAPISQPEAIF